jgi:hypothetical protein
MFEEKWEESVKVMDGSIVEYFVVNKVGECVIYGDRVSIGEG